MISLLPKSLSTVEKTKDFLTVQLYVSFIMFSNDSTGVFYMVGILLLIYLTHSFNYGFPVKFHFGILHQYMLGIALFCFLSAIWAHIPAYSIEKGVTMIELLIAFSLLYEVYRRCLIERLLTIVMWSGFILSIYTILFYGIDNLQDTIDEGSRLENTFANVNVIGMTCSMSIILAYYFRRNRKNIIDILMCIPCLLIVAGSGSRKAFMMLVLGFFILIFLNPYKTGKGARFRKLLLSIVCLALGLFVISKLGIFGGTLERMDGMVASFTGVGDIDSSSMLRAYYRELGFEQFLETPILGMGMGNARLLALKYSGHDCYLHCNYAEVAACGGMVGLFLVYWIFVKVIKSELSCIRIDDTALIVLVMILLNLILDYGKVSYYSKDTYFMIMLFCLHIESMKNRQIILNKY